MSSVVKNMIRGDDEVVNVSGELGDKTGTIKCDPHCYNTTSISTEVSENY